MTADTPSQGRGLLRRGGLQIVRFEATQSGATAARSWLSSRITLARDHRAIDEFTHSLAMLLKAGIPLAEGLGVLVRQAPRRIEPVVRRLAEKVKAGADFAQTLADEGHLFDTTYVGIVRVGQLSGMLEECLEQLVRLRRRQHMLRQRVHSALAYPTVVAVVGAAVVAFLMTYVVPRITEVLKQSGRALPLATRALMAVSNVVHEYWWLGLALAAMALAVARVAARQRWLRAWLGRQVLRLPVLGSLLMKAGIAQAAAMLETMLRSGMPLDDALAVCQKATRNVLLKEQFEQMSEALRTGRPLLDLAQRETVLPPVVMHMLAVGEQTGQLEEMLSELSAFYDEEVEVASRRAVSMLEPMVIVVMSCITGFIVLATILPILRMSGLF